MWKACLIASAVGACAELPAVEPGVCGNLVIEAAEDCDTFADPAHGGALACVACRYACDPAAASPACPDGWGCGRDGVCRHGVAAFQRAGALASTFPVTTLVAGDLDGDGAQELIGCGDGKAGILRAPSRQLAFTLRTSSGGDAVAAGDLDRDGHAELVRPSLGGIYGASGLATAGGGVQTRAMLAVQSLDLEPGPVRVAVARPNAGDGAELYALVPGDPVQLLSLSTLVPAAPAPIAGTAGIGPLLPVVAGNVHTAPGRAGDELVLGYAGGAALWIVELQPLPVVRATLALDFLLAGPPVLGDVDDDGDLDLVATGTDGSVAVYGNDGTGAFTARATPAFDGAPPLRCARGASAAVGAPPLAIADLDADGRTDYVTRDGVVLARAGGYCLAAAVSAGAHATAAVVADTTADGRLDVAWLTGSDTVVWLAVNQGGDRFEKRAVGITGVAGVLGAGTFDWDGAADVLVGAPQADGTTAFEIVRGTAMAGSDEVVAGPRVPGFADVAIGAIGELDDSRSDEIVIAGVETAPYVARMVVSPDGTSFFSDLTTAPRSTPRQIAIGDTDAGAWADDIVGLFESLAGEVRVWRWPAQSWYLSDREVAASAVLPLAATTPMTLADLAGDGSDDLVLATGTSWTILDLADVTAAPTARMGPAATALVRLPQPGGDCVIALTADGATARCGEASVAITTARPLGAIAVNLDDDAALELVIATSAGLELYAVDATSATALGSVPVALAGERAAMAAGDFDGDGVPDLAVGTAGTLELFWGAH